ncbi:fructosamine kinase family protein [Alteromonas sp. A081]|uniref:fructosamine kinase family protein n=1 Tax=Alteromonas sp. A081 TaxID=3410269 RepID=UPI003B97EF95
MQKPLSLCLSHPCFSIEKNDNQRKPIYPLYPILNHRLLFFAYYIVQTERMTDDIQRTKYA